MNVALSLILLALAGILLSIERALFESFGWWAVLPGIPISCTALVLLAMVVNLWRQRA